MWYLISAAELEQYLDEGRDIYLVDLREKRDYDAGHIRGAVNIPIHELVAWMGRLPMNALIVLYCYRGPRSLLAGRELVQRGFQVAEVCGGIQAYKGKYLVSGNGWYSGN